MLGADKIKQEKADKKRRKKRKKKLSKMIHGREFIWTLSQLYWKSSLHYVGDLCNEVSAPPLFDNL